jgi:hypothetical protein
MGHLCKTQNIDTQHIDTQHADTKPNETSHNWLNCDTQQKRTIILHLPKQFFVIMLVVFLWIAVAPFLPEH